MSNIITAARITGEVVVRPRGVKEMDERTPLEIINNIERLLDIEIERSNAILADNLRLSGENDRLRQELQQAQAREAQIRKNIECFDVLPCVNKATQWDNPPILDDRWIVAVCRVAELTKTGIRQALAAREGGAE